MHNASIHTVHTYTNIHTINGAKLWFIWWKFVTKSRPIIRKSFSVLFDDHRGYRKASIYHHLDINTFFLASFVHMKWIDMHSKITIQISDSGMEASHHRCMPQRNSRIWMTETGKWMDGWCVFSEYSEWLLLCFTLFVVYMFVCLYFSLFVPWMRHGCCRARLFTMCSFVHSYCFRILKFLVLCTC